MLSNSIVIDILHSNCDILIYSDIVHQLPIEANIYLICDAHTFICTLFDEEQKLIPPHEQAVSRSPGFPYIVTTEHISSRKSIHIQIARADIRGIFRAQDLRVTL